MKGGGGEERGGGELSYTTFPLFCQVLHHTFPILYHLTPSTVDNSVYNSSTLWITLLMFLVLRMSGDEVLRIRKRVVVAGNEWEKKLYITPTLWKFLETLSAKRLMLVVIKCRKILKGVFALLSTFDKDVKKVYSQTC